MYLSICCNTLRFIRLASSFSRGTATPRILPLITTSHSPSYIAPLLRLFATANQAAVDAAVLAHPIMSFSSGAPLSSDSPASSTTVFSPVRIQSLKSQIPDVPLRLLVPTSAAKCSVESPPLVKGKTTNARLGRPRSDSAAPSIVMAPKDERLWFDFQCRFDVVQENVQLSGYQIYAVEKW